MKIAFNLLLTRPSNPKYSAALPGKGKSEGRLIRDWTKGGYTHKCVYIRHTPEKARGEKQAGESKQERRVNVVLRTWCAATPTNTTDILYKYYYYYCYVCPPTTAEVSNNIQINKRPLICVLRSYSMLGVITD